MAMQHCDVLLAVGARFDDRVIGNPAHFAREQRRIIHIDVDPSSISKRVKVDVPIVGDVKNVLDDCCLVETVQGKNDAAALNAWWTQIELWRSKDCLKYNRNGSIIKPQYVWKNSGSDQGRCLRHLDVVSTRCGRHSITSSTSAPLDQFRRSRHHGGRPAVCDGRATRVPRCAVACITGESSIQMCIQELSTCKQYRIPVKVITLNTATWAWCGSGRILLRQPLRRVLHESLPDFVKLAEAYGHVGMRIDKPEDVEAALKEASRRAEERLVFMDFQTDQTENVFPMVEGGKGLSEMILAEEL